MNQNSIKKDQTKVNHFLRNQSLLRSEREIGEIAKEYVDKSVTNVNTIKQLKMENNILRRKLGLK